VDRIYDSQQSKRVGRHKRSATGFSSRCIPVKKARDKLIFAPPGESGITSYDRNGFTAVIKG
jgi:hypothetical protein